MAKRVLISDSFSKRGLDVFAARNVDVDYKPGLSPEELKACIADYSALVIRSGTQVTSEIIGVANSLKAVGRAGVGVDNVDVAAASRKGIVVMNTPGGNSVSTAELTISLILSAARKIPAAVASLKAGKWERKKFRGTELFGKTIGIIGLGRIGREVARRMKAFGMTVLAYDPFIPADLASRIGVELSELDKIYKNADVITVHIPKSSETAGMIGKPQFDIMKDGVIVANCARGGIIREDDLCDAVESGKVAAAAIDVYPSEPPENKRLLSNDKIVTTPHLGASTQEAQDNVAIAIAEQISDFLDRGIIANAINGPALAPEDAARFAPWLDLVERMGSIMGQVAEGAATAMKITYRGKAIGEVTSPVTATALKGYYIPILGHDAVNAISAPHIARDRGMKITEVRREAKGAYAHLVRMELVTEKGKYSISGTVFDPGGPRIVEMDGCDFEAPPDGPMLICRNRDVPGVIGALGTILGASEINIAGFRLGRSEKGGEAISICNVDTKVPQDVIDKISDLEFITSARMVCLDPANANGAS